MQEQQAELQREVVLLRKQIPLQEEHKLHRIDGSKRAQTEGTEHSAQIIQLAVPTELATPVGELTKEK